MSAARALGILALAVALTLAGVAGAQPPEQGGGRSTLVMESEDLRARALEILNRRCTVCHTAERFEARAFSSEEWDRVIRSMVEKGARLSGDELDLLRHVPRGR